MAMTPVLLMNVSCCFLLVSWGMEDVTPPKVSFRMGEEASCSTFSQWKFWSSQALWSLMIIQLWSCSHSNAMFIDLLGIVHFQAKPVTVKHLAFSMIIMYSGFWAGQNDILTKWYCKMISQNDSDFGIPLF